MPIITTGQVSKSPRQIIAHQKQAELKKRDKILNKTAIFRTTMNSIESSQLHMNPQQTPISQKKEILQIQAHNYFEQQNQNISPSSFHTPSNIISLNFNYEDDRIS
jgi:hypothetical protein